MRIVVLDDADAVARHAAEYIAAAARRAVSLRRSFVFASSGGRTPWRMLQLLAREELPWERTDIVQVDERIAPPGDPDRNLGHLRQSLAEAPLRERQFHPMPVESADHAGAIERYCATLDELAGTPALIDLVHLGLGADGHTASLIPGDAALDVVASDVAVTSVYQGRRRMTLTYPAINRARQILWVVTGKEKVAAFAKLCAADKSIPAGRVEQKNAFLVADRAAAGPEFQI